MIMTQEEKQHLLQDLSARLPYGVICRGICKDFDVNKDEYVDKEVTGILTGLHIYKCSYGVIGLTDRCDIESIKPCLRPMSSMSEDEKEEYKQFLEDVEGYAYSIDCVPQIDWLNAHHFDYRGLIEKGLALEAPKGMYNLNQ